jgi:excinuclease UvrABC ATPase subunit
MLSKSLMAIFCFVFVLSNVGNAQDYEYIGAAKCKMCHNKPQTGKQYGKWVNGPHAKAMESLSSEKSLAYAKQHNIADPTKEASCLKCHSTFHAINPDLNMSLKEDEGVSCESCHGPGSKYKSPSIMKDHAKSIANGLIVPDKALCVSCHNEKNPFHKPFDFAKYSAKIAHPNPAK